MRQRALSTRLVHTVIMRDKYFGSHEFQPREEVAKISSNRSFGLVFAAAFTVLAALGFWHGSARWPIWLGLACAMLALALAAPRLLAPFNYAWSQIGRLLHRIVGPVFLAVLFYGCIAPIGSLMRLSGKDPLRRKYQPEAETYWIRRTPPGPNGQSFKNQF
jgi:saxitoxin biosynthesis operon SxtJ-like protein